MRRSMTIGKLVTAAFVAVATGASSAGAQLDHSFEDGFAPSGSFATYGAGATFGSWTVHSGSIDLIGSGFWAAAEGVQSVDLNGNSVGAIFQNIATMPGATYDLSFWMSGNGSSTKTLDVYFGGLLPANLVGSFSWTGSPGYSASNMEWQQRIASGLTTTAASTPLYFVSTTAGCCAGPALDLVTLVQVSAPPGTTVPEPATVALMAGGLLGVGAVARRRRA